MMRHDTAPSAVLVLQCAALMTLLVLAACKQDATPASQTASATRSQLKDVAENKALTNLHGFLHCGDVELLQSDFSTQAAAFADNPTLRCEQQSAIGASLLHCQPTEPLRVFGARLLSFDVNHPEGTDQLTLRLRGEIESIKATTASIWQKKFAGDENALPLTEDNKHVLYFDVGQREHEAQVTCSMARSKNAHASLPEKWQVQTAPLPQSQSFSTDTGDEGVAALSSADLAAAIFNCGAEQWLGFDFAARLEAAAKAGLTCTSAHLSSTQAPSLHRANCQVPRGAKTFGGHAVTALQIMDDGESHSSEVTVATDAKSLASAMQADTMTELDAYPLSAGQYRNLLDDRFQHTVFAGREAGTSILSCRMWSDVALDPNRWFEAASDSAAPSEPENHHQIPTGSISGGIRHPSNPIPAMRICALYNGGDIHRCTETNANDMRYRIGDLPAAEYVVVAEMVDGNWRAGAHANAIRCIRAPCPQSSLITVTVNPGGDKTDIDLNEFLPERGDWPALPVQVN